MVRGVTTYDLFIYTDKMRCEQDFLTGVRNEGQCDSQVTGVANSFDVFDPALYENA